MSANSSSSSNVSLPPSSLPSSASVYFFMLNCFSSAAGTYGTVAYTAANVLSLLPLYVLVLHLGRRRRWRRQRCGETATSHADLLTYHMVVIELLSVFGSTLIWCGVLADLPQMATVGIYLFCVNVSGQMYFHVLTCVERYLAVVHPVTYLSLKKAKWIRVRNVTVGCVWLLAFAIIGLLPMKSKVSAGIISICVTTVVLAAVSFCSLSVLCVLIRPGPGEGGGDRRRVDQSKLRAFYTIMVILGVLLVRLGSYTAFTAAYVSLGETERCFGWLSFLWFSLPSSLVLPLLFLQRAGKLPCCKSNK